MTKVVRGVLACVLMETVCQAGLVGPLTPAGTAADGESTHDGVSAGTTATVVYDVCPVPLQVYPRDRRTDTAAVTVAGRVDTNGVAATAIALRVYRNDVLSTAVTQTLAYADNEAPFELRTTITAETALYDFEVVLIVAGGERVVVKRVEDVVAGDVLFIQGQSNAVAQNRSTSANGNQSTYVRSYGRNSSDGATTVADNNWYIADGDIGLNAGPGGVGQWVMRMGRVLVDTTGIPLAIINGAHGGQAIAFFQRNDADPTNLNTNYGRQLQRLRNAGLTEHIRAILWYQGESDARNADGHENGFIALCNDWMEDYPNVEHVYIQQIRTGCSANDKWYVDLRDRQRRLPDRFPVMSVMSTTGIDGHDGCHYSYINGYELLGNRNAARLAVDLFGSADTANTSPPNVDVAYFTTKARNEIKVVMRNKTDTLVFDAGAQADFRVEGSAASVISGYASSNTVVLALNGDASDGTGLTYGGHSGAGPWVTNAAGVGLLTFWNVPLAYSIRAPEVPSNFTAKARSSTRIDLAWDEAYGTDVYIVTRDGAVIVTTNGNTLIDTGLAAETEYLYGVTASNALGASAMVTASATTLAPPTVPPPAPTGVVAQAVSPNAVVVLWSDVAEATLYHVRRDGIEIGTTLTTKIVDTNCLPKTTYTYIVAAENSVGLSAYSDDATVVTPDYPVFVNVPEAAGYEIVYELDIPDDGAFAGTTPVPYALDRSAEISNGLRRVAYYLELDGVSGCEWVYVSMDAFTNDPGKIGLPHSVNNPVIFQQFVSNLCVVAGGGAESRVVTGEGIATGNIEFWPCNYSAANSAGIPGADGAKYDFGDGGTLSTGAGYGSFQVHNYGAAQTIFAYNDWGVSTGDLDDLGIGNNTRTGPGGQSHPDWTFMHNAAEYGHKHLTILAMTTDLPSPAPVRAARVSDSEVALSWTAPTGAVSYIVRRDGATVAEPAVASLAETGLQPGTRYTWSVTAVYTNGLSAAAVLAYTTTVHDVYDYVPEAADYDIVYHLNLPVDGEFRSATPVPYTIDNSAAVTNMTRVAYFLELEGPADGREWVYVSMDAFTENARRLGLPQNTLGYSIQQRVDNMNIFAGGAATNKVTTGTGIETGNMECWPNNYSPGNGVGIAGADGGRYDFDDTVSAVNPGHSCFQIHNYGARQTLLSYNKWGQTGIDALGIGNNTGTAPNGQSHPDWTFMETAGDYTVKSFVVLAEVVKEAPREPPTGLTVVTAGVARVQLEWNSAPGAKRYLVLRNGEVAGEAATPAFVDRNVDPGGVFTYCVAAVNAYGRSEFSESVTARTRGFTTTVFSDVPEAAGYDLIYALDLPVDGSYRDGRVPAYTIDRSDSGLLEFDRVAYYLRLDDEWVYVSMDAFTTNLAAIALPYSALGVSFQQDVASMNVFAGGGGEARVVTGTNLPTGNIEFWPNNYSAGANGVFDYADDINAAVNPGYGSFQVHNHATNNPHTIFAYNHWGADTGDDVGIGSSPTGNPDWTFAGNSGSYAGRHLCVLVRGNHDSDGDGLPDGWELRNFHGLAQCGDDDPDGDGLNNRMELAAGTRPGDASSRVELGIACRDGQTQLQFQTVTQRTYQVEFRTSLVHGAWEVLESALPGSGASSQVVDPGPFGNRYYRLGVGR